MRQPPPRPPRDHRPPHRRGLPVSVTAAAGVHGQRGRVRHQGVGRPRPQPRRHRRRAPVAAAAVFTQNKMTAAPVVTTNAHLTAHRRPGRRGGAQQRLRQRRHRAAGPGRRRGDVRRWWPTAARLRARRGARLLHRADRLPLPMDAIASAACPARGRPHRRRRRGGVAAAEAIRTTDTAPQGDASSRATGFVVGGMAKGAAMLAPNMATMLAVLTTDAAVEPDRAHRARCRPAWPRASTPCRPTAARPPTTR